MVATPARGWRSLVGLALVGLACGEPKASDPQANDPQANDPQAETRPSTRATVTTGLTDTLFADTLTLAVGQVRAWNLAAGRYRISVTPETGTDAPSALELGAEGVRCAPDRLDTSTIHCLLREPRRLVLKHNSVRTGAERARVTILRGPE